MNDPHQTQLLPPSDSTGGVAPVKRLIMVDDRPLMLKGFKDLVREMHNDAWAVVVHAGADDLLKDLERQLFDLPALVSIDLGLLPDPLSPTYGLELLERVHAEYPGLNLIVHSAILPIPDVAAQVILSIPASYISVAADADVHAFATLLPWLGQGFRVYSPAVSNVMSRIAITHPDPLNDDEWRVLEQLSLDKSNSDMAEALACAEGTVAEKINRIARRLNSLGYITVVIDSRPLPHKFRAPLKRFFLENAHKYGRRARPSK